MTMDAGDSSSNVSASVPVAAVRTRHRGEALLRPGRLLEGGVHLRQSGHLSGLRVHRRDRVAADREEREPRPDHRTGLRSTT